MKTKLETLNEIDIKFNVFVMIYKHIFLFTSMSLIFFND